MNTEIFKYSKINQREWDKIAEAGCEWTKPISHEKLIENKNNHFKVYISPSIPIPRDWLPDNIKGKKILGLACGGGQQMPILAVNGADCTVFDISEKQLEQDKFVMERENINYNLVQGDMTERFPFDNESFDIIIQAFCNLYIQDMQFVWNECYRVLKKGGTMIATMDNGINCLFKNQSKEPLIVENKLPLNSLEKINDLEGYNGYEKNQIYRFSHTLEDNIGGQLKAGFTLIDLYEDRDTQDTEGFLIKNYIPQYINTLSKKLF